MPVGATPCGRPRVGTGAGHGTPCPYGTAFTVHRLTLRRLTVNPPVCPACGARLAPGSTHCDLCGHTLGEEPVAEPERRSAFPDAAPEPVVPAARVSDESAAGPFCTHCGTKNPAYARFCYQCGHALVASGLPEGSVPVVETTPVIPAPPPGPVPSTPARPASDAGQRALVLVGAGVLAVVVLFFSTRASTDGPAPLAPTAAEPAAAPPPAVSAELPAEVEAQAAALEDEIAAASGEERRAKQEALAALYVQNGAFALAAPVQQAIAEAQPTALAWADAGSLYLAHMLRTQGPDRAAYAHLAAESYERSLALDDTDLDVKTDLATAYLNDAQNPMRAVETVKEVLAEAPEHVRANFNFGLMLAQINRADQAQEQFEKVIGLTEPGDPVRQRAEQELARLRAAQAGTASG